MSPKICYLFHTFIWYPVRFTIQCIFLVALAPAPLKSIFSFAYYNALPLHLSSIFSLPVFFSANNLDSSSLCPPFACLSFSVFRSLSSTHIWFLSLTFIFTTMPQSIPLTLVFPQLLVLPSPFHSLSPCSPLF